MAFCGSLSAFYLNVLNVIALACSICMLIYAGYLSVRFRHFHYVVHFGAIVSPWIFGFFILIGSGIGLAATAYGSKALLGIYFLFVIFSICGTFACGVTLLVFSGALNWIVDDINNGGNTNVTGRTIESRAVDLQLILYNRCCAERYNLPDASLNSPQDYGTDYNAQIDETICEALEDISVTVGSIREPLIGDPSVSPYGCGNGSPTLFVLALSNLMEKYLYPFGVVNICLTAVLILALLAVSVLLCIPEKETPVYVNEVRNDNEFVSKPAQEVAFS